jgi:Zn finger protein HypA/HybF involved in hydrogenase expression
MCVKVAYKAKSGARQWKPSLAWAMKSAERSEGFCLACGEVADGVEPDARKYECECCGAAKVYGGEELALMGLVH